MQATRTCSLPGCDRRHKGLGLCELHWGRLRRTGTTDSPVKSLAERFWPKVNKNGPTVVAALGPCWVWTAATKDGGYGVIHPPASGRGGPTLKAHRAVLMLAGVDIDGKVVRHRCDNPPCVRPDHLEVGTQTENVGDMIARGRVARGERRRTAKLTAPQVKEIRRWAELGEDLADIASSYGVSRSNVYRIVKREGWTHVE